MANEIKDKFSSPVNLSASFTGLAGSTTYVGRNSEWIDNSVDRYQKLLITARVAMGGSPSGSRGVYFFGLRDDGIGYRTDGALPTSGVFTGVNAPIIGVLASPLSPTSGNFLYGDFIFDKPGPKWAIGYSQDIWLVGEVTNTGHFINYIGINPEIQ
jgi:hypothetical protein